MANNKNKEDNRKIYIESSYGQKFQPLIKHIKNRAKFVTRGKEKGIINKESKSSIAIRDNGNVNIVSGSNAQYKLSQGGRASESTYHSDTITNRKKITADDIIINNHKLNPKLYEYADMKKVLNDDTKIVGNLNMFGTVLVRAWEPTLQKYVLIRRLVSMPIFSPTLNTPDIHPDFSVETELEKEFQEMVEVEKMAEMFTDFTDIEGQGSDKK